MSSLAEQTPLPREMQETMRELRIHRFRATNSRVVIPLHETRKPVVRIPPRASRASEAAVSAQTASPPQFTPSLAVGRAETLGPLGAVASDGTIARPAHKNRLALQVRHPYPSLKRNRTVRRLARNSPLPVPVPHRPPTSSRLLRWPVNALSPEQQKWLIAFHVVPWLLLLVVALRWLPDSLQFENWPVAVRTGSTLAFALYVLADTFFTIWHVAFRSINRL